MKTINELQQMTVREIANEARAIIGTHEYFEAKELLKNHIEVANQKIKEFSNQTNRELKTRRSAPQIRKITDFYRFK